MFPPEDASRFRNYRLYLHTKKVIQKASHVIAVSNSTKDDLVLVNIFNLDTAKISVVHNALDERFTLSPETSSDDDRTRVLERYQLKDPFILYSGRIRPHKNLQRLQERTVGRRAIQEPEAHHHRRRVKPASVFAAHRRAQRCATGCAVLRFRSLRDAARVLSMRGTVRVPVAA
jgi:hypothetical protein